MEKYASVSKCCVKISVEVNEKGQVSPNVNFTKL